MTEINAQGGPGRHLEIVFCPEKVVLILTWANKHRIKIHRVLLPVDAGTLQNDDNHW